MRLLRLNRVVRALDQYLEYGFITLILWMLFFCLCAHWMACIFYAIADHYDKFADIGWVRAMSDQTMQPLLIVNGTIVESPTLASLYMSSLYFSLTSLTSIGFGNIAPNTTAEKIFSCVTMIFGGRCNVLCIAFNFVEPPRNFIIPCVKLRVTMQTSFFIRSALVSIYEFDDMLFYSTEYRR